MTAPAVDVFQAIADPSRRQMLHLLSDDSLTISHLAQHFSMSRPAVSKHVKILSQAGFITIEDIGRERHCLLNPEGFNALQEWIRYFDEFWQVKLRKLEQLLEARAGK